jgi:hypothetical protein
MLAVVAGVVAIVLASSAAASTAPPTETIYSYDATLSYAQSASTSVSCLAVRSDVAAAANLARRSERGRPSDFLAAEEEAAVEATGQLHHVVSRPIAKAIEEHPNLAGEYAPRDPRFVTRAVDQAAHRGYQTWHRALDDEVVGWLQRNPGATTADFEQYLRARYSQPDLKGRFPNGF